MTSKNNGFKISTYDQTTVNSSMEEGVRKVNDMLVKGEEPHSGVTYPHPGLTPIMHAPTSKITGAAKIQESLDPLVNDAADAFKEKMGKSGKSVNITSSSGYNSKENVDKAIDEYTAKGFKNIIGLNANEETEKSVPETVVKKKIPQYVGKANSSDSKVKLAAANARVRNGQQSSNAFTRTKFSSIYAEEVSEIRDKYKGTVDIMLAANSKGIYGHTERLDFELDSIIGEVEKRQGIIFIQKTVDAVCDVISEVYKVPADPSVTSKLLEGLIKIAESAIELGHADLLRRVGVTFKKELHTSLKNKVIDEKNATLARGNTTKRFERQKQSIGGQTALEQYIRCALIARIMEEDNKTENVSVEKIMGGLNARTRRTMAQYRNRIGTEEEVSADQIIPNKKMGKMLDPSRPKEVEVSKFEILYNDASKQRLAAEQRAEFAEKEALVVRSQVATLLEQVQTLETGVQTAAGIIAVQEFKNRQLFDYANNRYTR